MLSVVEFPRCYRVTLQCPKCGRLGILFISSKRGLNGKKCVRIYHIDRRYPKECRVEIDLIPKDIVFRLKNWVMSQ